MTRFTAFKTSSAIALLFSASPAFADLSAEQAWEKFQSFGAIYGGVISAAGVNETSTGLDLAGIALTIDTPEVDVIVGMPDMSLRENNDGTVAVVQPETGIMTFTIRAEGEEVLAEVTVNMSGATQVISGDADNMVYDFTLPTLELLLDKVTAEGEDAPISGTIALSNYTGSYKIASGEMMTLDGAAAIDNITAEIKAWDPDGGDGKFVLNAAYDGIVGSSTSTIPEGMSMMDPATIMSAGFATRGGFNTQGGKLSFSFVDGSENAAGELSSEGGAGFIEMSKDAIAYDLSGRGVNATISGSEIPLPVVGFGLQDWAFKILVPTSKSTDERDYALLTRLGGLTVNDMMWMMVDPAGGLPHDPATVEVDLTGTAKLFFDLFNPESMMTMESDNGMPGELNSLILNKLLVSAVGAELTGNGAFTFDNSDLATFDGLPRPEGKVDLQLTGAYALIDKLVGMGLLPEDQAMGARMMMGLFARPGGGEDTLVSTIEVTPEGALMANGQRLK